METNDGGAAFPVTHQQRAHQGMSLRDYFAAKAMQAFCSRADTEHQFRSAESLCKQAYDVADAILAAAPTENVPVLIDPAELAELRRGAEELRFLESDVLYWVDRAVSKGNANYDTEEAWTRYEQWQQERYSKERGE